MNRPRRATVRELVACFSHIGVASRCNHYELRTAISATSPRSTSTGVNDFVLDSNLALGYREAMTKASEAARSLAMRSVAARRLKWGKEGFRKRMRAWGKLGGRPRTKKETRNAN